MKRIIFLSLSFIALVTTASTQPSQKLKQVLTLQMAKTADDDMPGTRGASVAWHPLQKKYYAAFAGNTDYPFGVFDAKGKRLSEDDQVCMADTRGLWYNADKKAIWGNGYDETGWFSYKLGKDGVPTDIVNEAEGLHQPNPQSVGAYNSAAKKVLFLNGSTVYSYDKDGTLTDSLHIQWGQTKKADTNADAEAAAESYNTSVVYTGKKGEELGFLNNESNTIELYSNKTGLLTRKLVLPDGVATEFMFNFAYANSIFWLFNIETRTWIGFK